ncbi:MAG TPA: hypothetical protein VGS07_20755 [Thermoanaerobaculia bacterium]|jgi:hypothetical protein|nr:hypothetical protein [Thermoanaerobaculia bacterium]
MKRNLKTRLTLHRETLRTLDGEELKAAPGGSAGGGLCVITDSCFNCTVHCVTATCPTRNGGTCSGTTTTC